MPVHAMWEEPNHQQGYYIVSDVLKHQRFIRAHELGHLRLHRSLRPFSHCDAQAFMGRLPTFRENVSSKRAKYLTVSCLSRFQPRLL